MNSDYPLDQLHLLPLRLKRQPGRWGLIASNQPCEDEALHLLDRLVALGLEARIHQEPSTGYKTLARVPVLP